MVPTTEPKRPSNAEALEHLAASGLFEGCQLSAGKEGLSGRVIIDGHTLHLRVLLPPEFPLRLPVIAVTRCDPPRELPHVFGSGVLCYETEAEMLLDRHDPCGVLLESVMRALATLRQGLSADGAKEFMRELAVYWNRMAAAGTDCLVTPGEHPAGIVALYDPFELRALADDARVYGRFLPARNTAGLRSRHAVYIPLDPFALDPGFQPEHLTNLATLRRYVRALPDADRATLASLLSRQAGPTEWVVLGIRRPEGERALLGLRIERITGGQPVLDGKANAMLLPVELRRRDHGFLAPRGGAGTDLAPRRVLVAGCGAVGGYIAFALARAGVGHVTLLDDDVFQWENTYRHVCGRAWIGHSKVEGLKKELERQLPYVTVTPHRARIEAVLRNQPNVVLGQELVISALGNPTIELELNERAWSGLPHPPMMFTWVEPFGLGGHVLLTRPGEPADTTRGCLQCLYRRSREDAPLENRAAFATPGGRYTRDVLGCGSRYLPFGDLDAQRTAEISSRLALRVLRGETRESPLLSWKGDRAAFEQAGYSVTPRYRFSSDKLEDLRLAYIDGACPVCAR